MKKTHKPTQLSVTLTIFFFMLIVSCDNNSSGSLNTEQLDNDNDPTNIEDPQRQISNQNNGQSQVYSEKEFIIENNFDEDNWERFIQDKNLIDLQDSSYNSVDSKFIAGESWKSFGDHRYRLVYYSQDGTLKAKPFLRGQSNQVIEITDQNIDSLNLQTLWREIEENMKNISVQD